MMTTVITKSLAGLFFLSVLTSTAFCQSESDQWQDIMPGKNLKGWKRVPHAPDTEVSKKSPWVVDRKNNILKCNAGPKTIEMLLYQRPVADGVYHVEWRFVPVPGKKEGYNSGVYVRASADGKKWIQVQTAVQNMRPQVGDVFGDLLVDGKVERVINNGPGMKYMNPVGEWNTYDIICKGKTITSKLNGHVISTMKDCQSEMGHIGLQAEFHFIEFKNLKWKSTK